MTTVTIFGSGNMGTAIDQVLTAGGASVDHIRSADPPGPVNGDIVVLAVYHPAVNDILESMPRSWPARSSSTSPIRWTWRRSTRWSYRHTVRSQRILSLRFRRLG